MQNMGYHDFASKCFSLTVSGNFVGKICDFRKNSGMEKIHE